MAKEKTFRKLCKGKVWRAIQAMIDGLNYQSKRKDFTLDMASYGYSVKEVCFACAATCAVQELTQLDLNSKEIAQDSQAVVLNVKESDLFYFEWAINLLRMGNLYGVFDYMKKGHLYKKTLYLLPALGSLTWEEDIDAYQNYANKLKQKDI